MSTVEHIENQIRQLSQAEFAELRDWMLEQDWAAWDTQIEADVREGRLDKAAAEAREDFAAGRTRAL